MANGKAVKNRYRKVVEGEQLAANALAVAIGKVKEVGFTAFIQPTSNESRC